MCLGRSEPIARGLDTLEGATALGHHAMIDTAPLSSE